MKKNRHPKPLTVSHSRWLAYATAGAASALAGLPAAEAEIHYSGRLNIKVDGLQVFLPLSNGASLVFLDIGGGSYYQQADFFGITGATIGSGRAYFLDFGRNWVKDLNVGSNVSAGTFAPVTDSAYQGVLKTYLSFHQFDPPDNGIIGFRFNTGKGLQYGWARINPQYFKSGFDTLYRFTIEDYAWGDPGDRIKAGQKHSLRAEADAAPASGSLGLLAVGATGLKAWRASRGECQAGGR